MSRSFASAVIASVIAFGIAFGVLGAGVARADVNEAPPRPDEQFDFMNLLRDHGYHDINDETWNAYGQLTYISSWHPSFDAPYTNANGSPNSLLPVGERSWTGSFTVYLGVRLPWKGAEVYFAPEVISEQAFSGLHGIGGAIQNFELQKTGVTTPQLYRSRLFFQQTIGLGGKAIQKPSDPMQLASVVDARRLVLRAGSFSVIDFFDKNTVSGDPRQQFLNMAFMTYSAFDFVADARGYTYGATAELFYDDWAVRIGRLAPPANPNSLPLTLRVDKYYGDQIEIEHQHALLGKTGAVRVLGYRNYVQTGRFNEAIAAFNADHGKNAAACTAYNYGSQNATAPDLCWVRRGNAKVGIGLNLEQHITDDVGVFFRGMISDGKSEVYAFTSTDRSLSFGIAGKGSAWKRPIDVAGVGMGFGWISKPHADYLGLGGIDGFIGDGHINQAAETVVDVFYSVNIASSVWLSADYQRLWNPAFNADRGPVDIFGTRVHAEF